MKQIVTIQDNKNGVIKAGCDRSLCEGCRSSLFCTSKKASFDVLNPDGIKLEKGDQAVIDMPTGKTLFTVFMSFGLPLIMFIPGYIIGSLISDSQGVQLISSNFFAAIGKPVKGLLLSMTRQVFFLIPLLLILPVFLGLDGIMFAGPAADSIAFVTAVILVGREMGHMRRLQEEQQ